MQALAAGITANAGTRTEIAMQKQLGMCKNCASRATSFQTRIRRLLEFFGPTPS
jgi:hypothetical protein